MVEVLGDELQGAMGYFCPGGGLEEAGHDGREGSVLSSGGGKRIKK